MDLQSSWVVVVALLLSSCSSHVAPLASRTDDQGIEIRQGDERVLFYQVKPKSLNGKFQRASYIHPLYSLDGNPMTEDFPRDHPHHHGIYSAWHQVIVGDTVVGDGWTGKNVSLDVIDTKVKKVGKRLVVQSEVLWKSSLGGKETEPIVREVLAITVHETQDTLRIIDYDFVLTALKEQVKVGGSHDEKGYGGFSLRFMLPENIRFLAQEGEVQAQVVAVNAGPWMNFTGSFDGPAAGASGVVVLSHPSNPGHPQPWILRKEKSMQNAAFPGREPVSLSEDGLAFRYRMVVYEGELASSVIQKMYRAYSED